MVVEFDTWLAYRSRALAYKVAPVFTRGSFRKGVRVPIGVPGRGVWGRVQGVVRGGFPVENEGKGEGGGRRGGGGGVGTGKGTGNSMRKLFRDYALANYPLVSPLFFQDAFR